MDITAEYVKMCENSEEIQEMLEGRDITNKDFLAKKPERNEGGDIVWLPRADQLIELLCASRENDDAKAQRDQVFKALDVAKESLDKNPLTFTLEQALLCAFMFRSFGKKWNPTIKVWEKS